MAYPDLSDMISQTLKNRTNEITKLQTRNNTLLEHLNKRALFRDMTLREMIDYVLMDTVRKSDDSNQRVYYPQPPPVQGIAPKYSPTAGKPVPMPAQVGTPTPT